MSGNKCPFCKTELKDDRYDGTFMYLDCLNCGGFVLSESFRYNQGIQRNSVNPNKAASFLFYDKIMNRKLRELRAVFLHTSDGGELAGKRVVTELDIENWYPKNFQEKVDKILLALAAMNKAEGEPIPLERNELAALLFVDKISTDTHFGAQLREPQGKFFAEYFKENGLVTLLPNPNQNVGKALVENVAILLPKAYNLIYELQKNNVGNKDVFIAMAFATQYEYIRNNIIEAIRATGYTEKIMQTHQTNNWIMPEIFHLIRQSRFVIVDLTSHNLGAYYESGFAEGIGKPVIHICKEDIFRSESHFDVKQKATVLWNTPEELTTRLIDRIEATIGRV